MSYPKQGFQNLPQNLTLQQIRNPYTVIEDFFGCYDIAAARRYLDKWVRSAFAEKSRLGKNESLDLLDLQEHLIRLLETAQLLNDDSTNEEKGLQLTPEQATPINTSLYANPQKSVTPWECFPRHLSLSEYANPYMTFELCLGQLDLTGWRQFLKDLFYAAAYDTQINEAVNDDDLYNTCKCLFKLVEACHLIKVREIDPHVAPEQTPPASPLSKEDVLPPATELKAA